MKELSQSKPYWSCSYIESGITMQNEGLIFCCERVNPDVVFPKGDPASAIDDFLAMRERVIRRNQQSDAPCKGCPLLQKRDWNRGVTEYKIDFINFGVQSYCQFSCTYCCLQKDQNLQNMKNCLEPYDSIGIVKELKHRNMLSKHLKIAYAAGEIAVHPKRAEYFKFIEENAYIVIFASNAGKYDEKMAEILQKNKCNNVTVSIDAGTRDTFRLVHGVDAFETVIANLKKYNKRGAQIYLKYILLNENCQDADFDGFVKICKDINAVEMSVSADAFKVRDFKKETFCEQQIVKSAVRLVEKAIQNNISFRLINYLGNANLKEIYRALTRFPKLRQCEAKFNALLRAPNLIFYGAGKNCEILLETWNSLGLQKPSVIWDIAADSGLQSSTSFQGYGCPVAYPDFKTLDSKQNSVFITITNDIVNKELITRMQESGFYSVMSQYDLSLALIAKQALLK